MVRVRSALVERAAVSTYTLRVGAPNAAAARLALRVWVAGVGGAILYGLLGGDCPWVAVAAMVVAPLALFALPAAAEIALDEQGLTRRGLVWRRTLPWDQVRRIRFERWGGVERYHVSGRFTTVTLSSECAGFEHAALRLGHVARFRAIPITTR